MVENIGVLATGHLLVFIYKAHRKAMAGNRRAQKDRATKEPAEVMK